MTIRFSLLTTSFILCALLTGCVNLTGLKDAESDFACSVEMHPYCGSLSSVHERINELAPSEATVQITTEGVVPDRLALETPLMTPKRAPEELLRIWVAPYIDEEGDLHAEHVIFTTVRTARWAPDSLEVKSIEESSSRLITPLKGHAP